MKWKVTFSCLKICILFYFYLMGTARRIFHPRSALGIGRFLETDEMQRSCESKCPLRFSSLESNVITANGVAFTLTKSKNLLIFAFFFFYI